MITSTSSGSSTRTRAVQLFRQRSPTSSTPSRRASARWSTAPRPKHGSPTTRCGRPHTGSRRPSRPSSSIATRGCSTSSRSERRRKAIRAPATSSATSTCGRSNTCRPISVRVGAVLCRGARALGAGLAHRVRQTLEATGAATAAPFRLIEVNCLERKELASPVHYRFGAAAPDEQKLILDVLRATLPHPYIEAVNLVPEHFDLGMVKQSWEEIGLRRARAGLGGTSSVPARGRCHHGDR